GAAAGARVDAVVIVDGQRGWSEQATLDAGGRARFRFRIPDLVQRGAARFVATVHDGGLVETGLHPFVVPTGGIEVAFHPEAGQLVTGLPARVYVQVKDALGRPITAAGRILDDRD